MMVQEERNISRYNANILVAGYWWCRRRFADSREVGIEVQVLASRDAALRRHANYPEPDTANGKRQAAGRKHGKHANLQVHIRIQYLMDSSSTMPNTKLTDRS
ncbi:hypothetical protein EV356DRAFT_510393 [Viridothelium virens]|uniref:Uncharacterized protein n=1 Tax=Viridothelium virens TaxID=1048519 RepID=A0A6A6GVE1_VIRVR|nr:hypothetical protein EV356DRAFT_510393 [Viridothelium virens]